MARKASSLPPQAGVDSIEHGTYIDADDIAAMKQHGTWLVPTLYLIDWMRENGHLPAMFQKKMLDVSAVVKREPEESHRRGREGGAGHGRRRLSARPERARSGSLRDRSSA